MPASLLVPEKLPAGSGLKLRPARVFSLSGQQALWPIISGLAHGVPRTVRHIASNKVSEHKVCHPCQAPDV